jgi:hypothetical protein
MPLTRLVCYCDSCRGEKDLPVADALRHAEERQGGRFSYELLSAMLAQVQDRGTRISTTTLSSKCLRSEVILRTEDYTGDPARMYASFRGTMFHGQLERHAHPGSKAEPRYHKELGDMGMFSGSPDLVDVTKGTLYDYKFTKENPRYDSPWKDHVAQGQVNRWLIDHADYVEWEGHFYPLTERGADVLVDLYGCENPGVGEWDLALNRENFVPQDWQGIYVVYMDDRGPKPLLCTKSIQVPKKDGNGTKAARVADIWSDEVAEKYVLDNYVKVRRAFDNITEDPSSVPPIPEDFTGWSHPLCEWCAVKDSCINHFIHDAQSAQTQGAA